MRHVGKFLLGFALLAGCRSSPASETEVAPGKAAADVFVFRGAASFDKEALLEVVVAELAAVERNGLGKADVDDAAYALEEHYRASGFPFALVDYELTGGAESDPEGEEALALPRQPERVIFQVDEGARLRLTALLFDGNETYTDKELRTLVLGDESNGNPWFVRRALDSGIGEVRGLYYGNGFLDIAVEGPELVFVEDKKEVRATITVTEGPAFRLASFSFKGEIALPEEQLAELGQSLLRLPYTPRVGYELRARLLEFYGRRGYPDATIEFHRVNADGSERVPGGTDGEVHLRYDIQLGPEARINRIEVVGNERTGREFIRSRIEVDIGDRYDSERIRKSFSNLFATGLFESVRIELGEELGTARTLRIYVEESPAFEIFAEPGYGSYEGLRMRLGAKDGNVFGTGRDLLFETTVSEKSLEGLLTFVDPRIFDSEFTVTTSLFGKNREEPSFTVQEYGAVLSLARRWTSSFHTTFNYKVRRTELDDIDIVDPNAQEALEDVDIASLGLGAAYDTRSDVFIPSRGGLVRFGLEWASSVLGSEVDFLKTTAGWFRYGELREGTVVAIGAETGIISPIGDTNEIPIQERFFNGGDDSVRSFHEDELGPLDAATGDPLGGEASTTLSIELRQKLVGSLSGSLFYDWGNVQPQATDYFEFENMRSGVGLGIRYLLPIGHLRLDGAWNPNVRGNEDDFVLHFAVGMAF